MQEIKVTVIRPPDGVAPAYQMEDHDGWCRFKLLDPAAESILLSDLALQHSRPHLIRNLRIMVQDELARHGLAGTIERDDVNLGWRIRLRRVQPSEAGKLDGAGPA